MYKATITKQGKGWKITFEDGKFLTINWQDIPNDWDGADILVQRENGQPVKLERGTQVINKPQSPSTSNTHNVKKHNHNNASYKSNQPQGNPQPYNQSVNNHLPKTPYNFVPLNEVVVYPPAMSDFDTFDGLSGHIEVSVTNKTDMFIRGDKTDFLHINDKTILPGASWRGLTRNMVEMLSYGKFVTFTKDRRLYARNKNATIGRKLGFLKYEIGGEFKIYEASSLPTTINKGSSKFSYRFEGKFILIHTGFIPNTKDFKIEYSALGKSYTVDSSLIKSYQEDDSRGADGLMKDLIATAKSEKLKNNVPPSLTYIGVPVWYINNGNEVEHFGHCKNYRIPAPENIGGHVPSNLQIENQHDFAENIFGTDQGEMIASRVFFEDLICEDAKFNKEVTALRILSSPKPTSYQLYLTQINSNVSAQTWLTTPASTIRGYKQYWHRVTQDLRQENSVQSYSSEWVVKKSDFKQYLTQKVRLDADEFIRKLGNNIKENGNNFVFTNGLDAITNQQHREAIIDYFFLEKDNSNIKGPQNTLIKALKPNNIFTGRVRFENLSKEALGALLFALDLPKDCCHKIGMGKPLGLGTIRIDVTHLHVSDRKKRYNELLSTDGTWLQPSIRFDIQSLKNDFEQYIQRQINDTVSLWDNKRLKHLKAMLEFDAQLHSQEKNWLERTRYMLLEEFKKKEILKQPKEIKP